MALARPFATYHRQEWQARHAKDSADVSGWERGG